MGMYKRITIVLMCFGICGCSTLMNRMPAPVIQEKDMIYEVRPGTTLDLYYGGKAIPTTLNESRYLVSEELLIDMASNKTMKILNQAKARSNRNKILVVVGSFLAIFASIAGIILTGKIKSLIPKKITANLEVK